LHESWNFYIVFGVWILAVYLPYSYFVIKAVKNQKESVRPVAAPSMDAILAVEEVLKLRRRRFPWRRSPAIPL